MSNTHIFKGKWISLGDPSCQYAVFRKNFELEHFNTAEIFIAARQYYKLFINGLPVCTNKLDSGKTQYDRADVSDYLMPGENTVAVLVFRNDSNTPSLLADLCVDGEIAVASNESFVCSPHTGIAAKISSDGISLFEDYDSRSNQNEFEYPDFDDSSWEHASVCGQNEAAEENPYPPYSTHPVKPTSVKKDGNVLNIDFGSEFKGTLYAEAKGKSGDIIYISYGQDIGENWTLSGEYDTLAQVNFKNIRRIKMTVPESATLDTESITLISLD